MNAHHKRTLYKPRKKKRISKKVKSEKKYSLSIPKLLSILVFFLVIIFISHIVRSKSTFWDGEHKVFIVSQENDSDVKITVLDPKIEEITTLIVPHNTRVTAARQYGVVNAGRIWDLGRQEGLSGQLLVESLAHHAHLPVHAYIENDGIFDNSLPRAMRSIFVSGDTNISFIDKVQIAFFSARVGNTSRSLVDLSRSTYLSKSILPSGEDGYILTRTLPASIAVLFSYEDLSQNGVSVHFIDRSGKPGLVESIGTLVEALGAKVISIEKGDVRSLDCIVRGNKREYLVHIAGILSCDVQITDVLENTNIEIVLGETLAKRY